MFLTAKNGVKAAILILMGASLGVLTLQCGAPERLTHRDAGTPGQGGATVAGAAGTGAAGDSVTGAAGDALPTGAAGDSAAAGTNGAAGTVAAAGTNGAAGTVAAAGTNGAAGTVAAAGTNGAAGTVAAAGTNGAAGTVAAAGTNGAAGANGAAGTVAAAGTTGAAGMGVCMNSTVVTAGGSEATCPVKTTWKATAMPTPPSMYLGIPDTQLQPQYAIDGNAGSRYSTGATIANGFYYQVDLGVAKMVSGITVDTSEGADTLDVANGYDVGLSTDGTNFTTVATCAYNAAPMEVINFKATMARYVRYTNKAPPGPKNGPTSWLSIHEFNIRCN